MPSNPFQRIKTSPYYQQIRETVVVKDGEEYQSQCEKRLGDKDIYKEIETKNPTKLLKGRIKRKLRAIKNAGHIDPNIYNKIYHTSDTTPHFYTTCKIHKDSLKMRLIVSSINSITYHLAWHLADLLKPLVGKKNTYIQISKDLVDKLKHIELEKGEVLTSFDVTALFTSMPGKEVVQMAI